MKNKQQNFGHTDFGKMYMILKKEFLLWISLALRIIQ